VRLLLDTHALLWWLDDDARLSHKARQAIFQPANQVLVSAISGWEISIKQSLGRLDITLETLEEAISLSGFDMLPISLYHGLTAGALPALHRDPFDRMLVAQSQAEGLRVVSCDRQLAAYDVDLLW
jgi:PIN domain nuclease of toxin-antitoxin system